MLSGFPQVSTTVPGEVELPLIESLVYQSPQVDMGYDIVQSRSILEFCEIGR